MKLRAAYVIGFGFACAMITAACSFSDHVEHCNNDTQCSVGRCYEGFCVAPNSDATSSSAQIGSDGGTSQGGSGGKGGSGSKPDQTASGSGKQTAGGAGGSRSAGRTGGTGGSANGGSTSNMMPAASDGNGEPCKGTEERACLIDPTNKTLAENCNRGMQACEDGAWGVCNGQPMPAAESCNGLDDDCNGMVDDFMETCYPDGQVGCSKGSDGRWSCAGSCGTGKVTCRDGKPTECEGATLPGTEVCTAAGEVAGNEDCDQKTDEGCNGTCRTGETRSCYSGRTGTMGVGKCVAGTQTCANGAFGTCVGEVHEQAETCANPNADDDCNGKADDVPTLNDRCVVAGAMGPCQSGTRRCSGTMLTCQPSTMPTQEVCNSRDDDCNGTVDDGFNLRRDPKNCGMCGHACATGEDCCASACVNHQTDANNCGACGTKCASSERCMSGKCMSMSMPMAGMPAGGTGAGGSSGTGGSAGGTAGGGAACSPACGAGETCCNGSCVNLMSDIMQCGACGNACTGTKPGCCGGACVDLTKDENCGQCAKNCGLLHVMNGTETVLCQCSETNGTYDCQGRVLGLGLCLL